LRAAGIQSRADLDRLGPVSAYVAAKDVDPNVTLNLLWGLAAAFTDTHWTRLSADYRASLLREYDAMCDQRRILASSSTGRLSEP
jgi:hypothetical protein